MAVATTGSSPAGAVTDRRDGGGGTVFSALCMIVAMLPSNGRSPVSS